MSIVPCTEITNRLIGKHKLNVFVNTSNLGTQLHAKCQAQDISSTHTVHINDKGQCLSGGSNVNGTMELFKEISTHVNGDPRDLAILLAGGPARFPALSRAVRHICRLHLNSAGAC